MKHKSFPKEGIKKLKETIQELKALVRELEIQNKILKDELNNIVKPSRSRKVHEPLKPGSEAWRKDFVKRVKEGK